MFKKWLICTFLIIYSFAFGYSEQVVVSQFDVGLKDNSSSGSKYKYSLTGITKSDDIRAIDSTDLSDVIDQTKTIGASFTGAQSDLKYSNSGQKSVIIPVKRNESTSTTTGAFQLTEATTVSGESALTYLIQDNITLPAKTIVLSQDTTVSTGVKFTYTDSAKAAHLSAYKMQKFMIRIAKSSISDTNYDVVAKSNGVQLANSTNALNGTSYAQSFLDGNTGYIDFWVTADQYDKAQSISTDVGLSLKFMPEDIEVLGLPKGSYRMELYSFRYSKEVTTKGNVVITKEDNKSFSVGDTEFLENGIDIMNFSSSEFKTIKATILTVGTTTSPSITVSEDNTLMSATITSTSGSIYVDSSSSGALSVNSGGTLYGGKYYQLWSIVYDTTNTAINTATRSVAYIMNGDKIAKTTYSVISSTAQFTSEPLYQTVFAGFKDTTFSIGTFEIDDRTVNKYSDGYRNVRTANVSLTGSAIDMATLYKGVTGSNMTPTSYNWVGTTATAGNSLIISKVKSDSKGTFQNVNDKSKKFTFYTTNWEPNIVYEESGATTYSDTANFSWTAPSKTSYDTTVNEDKVIFRIMKSTSDSETYRYKPEANTYPIKNSSSDLTAFLSAASATPYFDVIFTSGEDGKLSMGDVVFNFSKNNTFQIVGLTAGDYKLQIYSLQNEDIAAQADSSYDYRVLTFGGTSPTFTMGLPILETGDYANQNNIYLIDSINLTSSLDSLGNPKKDVEVGFIIKAEEAIANLVPATNLVAKKDEVSTTNSALNLYTDNIVTEMWNNSTVKTTDGSYTNIKAVTNPVLSKADKADFQYPLDIVFLIDNSGSMDNEISSVKEGLDEFSSMLTAKGYDVAFNLITFGPQQTSDRLGTSWYTKISNSNIEGSYNFYDNNYLAIYKDTWFIEENGLSALENLKNAFDNIDSSSGYRNGQENGAWAIHHGIDKLKTNGRYLDSNFKIVDSNATDKYLPSKKWIIFLTDENMDTSNFPTRTDGGTAYNSTNVVAQFASQLNSNDITLTGIYHTDTIVYDSSTEALYKNAISSTTVETNNSTSGSQTTYYANIDSNKYTISQSGYYYFTMNGTDYDILNSSYQSISNISTGTYYYKTGVSYPSLVTSSDGTKIGNYDVKYRKSGKAYLEINNVKYNLLDSSYNEVYNISGNTSYYYNNPTSTYSTLNVTSEVTSSWTGNKILNFKDKLNHDGIIPSEPQEVFYSEFALKGLGTKFNMYEMGNTGQYVSSALKDSISNIGIIQRWNLKYTSPFPANDGYNREVIFSLKGLKKISSVSTTSGAITYSDMDITSKVIDGTRIYNVPEQKIEAYFMNPSESVKQLEKINGNINLKAKARSQYKKEIDGVLQWVNYPITKGTFIITGNYSNDGVTAGAAVSKIVTSDDTGEEAVILTDTKIDDSTWYYGESNIDAKDFTATFGKNPMNVVVKFIAETAEESKTITLSGVKVVDKTAPKITSLKMTNSTLNSFMSDINTKSSTEIFTGKYIEEKTTTDTVTTDSGITANDIDNTSGGGISLNIKDGDKVKIEFTIDDESVDETSNNGTVKKIKVLYEGNPFYAVYDGVDNSNTEYPYRTKWHVDLDIEPNSDGDIENKVTLDITDDSNDDITKCNNTNIQATVFNQPNLLENTKLNSDLISADSYKGDANTDYYNTEKINAISKTDALGYLMVFDYDSASADTGAVNTGTYVEIDDKKWLSSKDGDFSFYDGKHTYNGTVYVMNSAGAILGITHNGSAGSPSEELRITGGVTIENVVKTIEVPNSNPSIFYVDTVIPVVKSIKLEKKLDANSELNNSSNPLFNIINGIIGETVNVTGGTDYKRPFKAGDNLSLTGSIIEKNIAKSLIAGENIFTDENFGTISGMGNYSKTGIAKDLGEQINELRDVTIYDKAGNKADYITDGTTLTPNKIQVNIVYDDRTPNNLETKATIVDGVEIKGNVTGLGNSIKFTKNNLLPLTSATNGVPLSLVIVDSTNYGDVRTGTGDLKGIGYSVSNDRLYEPVITTYSYSGVKGTTIEDKIILDTTVGSLDSSVNLKAVVAKITEANLNSIFNGISEMVGLAKYSISTTSTEVSDMKLGSNSYTKGELKALTGAPYYQVASKPNPANITGGSDFTFSVPSGGSYTFTITVYDRLNNPKDINYVVQIPNNVNIIGKKAGMSKIISTKVNNSSNKMKIESRTE